MCCRFLARYEKQGGGGGGGVCAIGIWPNTKSVRFVGGGGGGGGGRAGYDRVSGSPGYSTVLEFEFIHVGGGCAPSAPPPPLPPLKLCGFPQLDALTLSNRVARYKIAIVHNY